MPFVPTMWTVWLVLLVSFVALRLYIARLSRDEDDELVLGESLDRLRAEQATITTKLHKVEPLEHVVLWVLAGTSVIVAVYYIHDMISQFK
ncbi:MAG TPA: hypothetical protein VL991_12365 [Terracidiphilus sp.]|nr:hypothetical protein [Terracidiphilus sp.]